MTVKTAASSSSGNEDIFVGQGEIAALLRQLDWAASPLGSPETWPQSLRSIVRMMLTSNYQMWMGWGPELAYLYNDAYRPTLGVKHPDSLAKPVATVWKEIWPDIGPLIEKVLSTGEPHFGDGMLLLLERSGYPEETYHTFSYSPLFDDAGAISGLFCVVVEETERVLNERRLATIRELASSFAGVSTEADLFAAVTARLSENLRDLPFTLTYLLEDDGRSARLVSASGFDRSHPAAVEHLTVGQSPWPFEALLGNAPAVVVEDLHRLFGPMPSGAWEKPPQEALLVPIAQQAHDRSAAGFMVVGLNPYRVRDQTLKDFILLLAGQVAAALATVRAYEEERRRAAALAEIDRAKTVFFSNVSHEFRTPLTLMLGPLEDAMAGELPPEILSRQIELAHRNGRRLLRLVNSLLDFSRIEAGRVQATYEPVDLCKFTTEIASSFRSAMERAGLALEVHCEPLPEPAFVDRDMWEKVVLNLLSNAFKFTHDGGVTVRVETAGEGSARVSVADTGIGIPAEEMPRLFERFHRVEGAQGRSFEGSGIGLAMVQELVRLHGGEITAESAPGKGTTFTVQLPLGRSHLPAERVREVGDDSAVVRRAHELLEEALRWLPESEQEPEAARELSQGGLAAFTADTDAKAGAGKRVLLADDNVDMRAYVARLLQGQGYQVVTASDGEEALRLARAAPPDLVLTDVMMPKLDGFALLRELRGLEATAGVPIIMLTARAGEEAKVEGLDAGADDYLIKPFAARELLARVNAAIQMAEVRREANRKIWDTEHRYRITSARLSRALSTGGVGVFEWELEGDRLSVLGPIAELYGVDRAQSEATGLPLVTFIAGLHPDDRPRVEAALSTSIETGQPYAAEYRVIGSGTERIVRALGEIETTEDGQRRMAGVVIDVTELRRTERELQLLNERLEQRVAQEVAERTKVENALRQAQKIEALGKLTGGVAHDFNNLLQVISGNLQLLAKSVAGNPRAEARIENALAGVARGSKLASQLLAFGRRQPLEPKVVNIGRFIKGMDDMLRRALGEEIEVETVVAGGLWNTLVDPSQIENAILNLTINARDAMDGHGRLTIEASNAFLDEEYARTHDEVAPGQYVLIAVTDTGCGIPADVLEQVFEPFFTTKPEGKGTGLGLSMVHGFVKQSGGHIKIYSEVGEGTTIKLYLPRSMETEDVLVDTSGIPVQGGSETVLVVEDDDEVRETAVAMLSELGYRVLKAREATAALGIVESGLPIDLLFTDVVMPGPLRSPELARKAKKRLPNIAVLFTSGYTENAIVHGGRLDPGVELLPKPYTREALARKLRHVLSNAAQKRIAQAQRLGHEPGSGRTRSPPVAGATVLLVEDDDLIRSSTAEMLRESGHLVIEASDADSALQTLTTSTVDVVIADVGLPSVSGLALAREVKAKKPDVKIVFATGDPAISADVNDLGAALLGKPYSRDDLGSVMASVLASGREGGAPQL